MSEIINEVKRVVGECESLNKINDVLKAECERLKDRVETLAYANRAYKKRMLELEEDDRKLATRVDELGEVKATNEELRRQWIGANDEINGLLGDLAERETEISLQTEKSTDSQLTTILVSLYIFWVVKQLTLISLFLLCTL